MILLSIICGVLALCLGISIWYIRQTLNLMFQITQDVQKMHEEMEEFALHLQNVYKMEMYYGDATLEKLISHSKDTLDSINAFKSVFSVDEEHEPEEKAEET